MAAGYVPEGSLAPLYANTTPGVVAQPQPLDDAVIAIVQVVNDNYDASKGTKDNLADHKNAQVLDHHDQSVTTAKIRDANVTTVKLADSSVTTGKIANAGVTRDKLQDNAVNSSKLENESVSTTKLMDLSVTKDKLAYAAVTQERIANGAVGSAQIDPALFVHYGDIATQAKFAEYDAQLESIEINVSDFGAVGDGITDDSQAFINIFNYAKNKNLKVSAQKKRYFISTPQSIEIYNGVDFGGAEFIIDDTKGPDTDIFKISHTIPRYSLDAATLNLIKNKILKSTRVIPELAGLGNAIVYVYDSSTMVYIREGVNQSEGEVKSDFFTIDNQGYITSPLSWDFSNVSYIFIQKMDDNSIEIKNGTFISSNNVPRSTIAYTKKGFYVNRSNVIMSNLTHRVASEDTPNLSARSGFITVENCANVIVENINLQPLKIRTDGTYEFGGYKVVNFKISNLNSQSMDIADRWGSMGANFLKNVIIKDSNINRVDVHKGAHNLTIENCTIGTQGVHVTGFGDLIINNSKFYSDVVVTLRSDYGSFWDGNIYFDGIYQRPNTTSALIAGYMVYDWNYGQPSTFGKGLISVNKYIVDGSVSTNDYPVLFMIRTATKYDGIEKTKHRVSQNIRVTSAHMINRPNTKYSGFKIFHIENLSHVYGQNQTVMFADGNFYPNISVHIESVDLARQLNYQSGFSALFSTLSDIGFNATDNYGTVLDRLFFKITVDDCPQVNASINGLYAYLYITKSQVESLVCNNAGVRSFIHVSDSTIKPTVSSASQVLIHGAKDRLHFSNCRFMKSYYSSTDGVVNTSNLPSQYEFLKLGLVGTTASIEANLSSCTFDPSLDFATLRADIKKTGFVFGNNVYTQKFPMKIGTTSERPPAADIFPSYIYFDTTINKLIVFDGTNWRDYVGAVV